MPSVQSVEQSFKSQLTTIGRAALNALYGSEIEFYILAIELVDSQGNTEEYFSFPVLPEEIRNSVTELTRINKTIGGINVLANSSFTPTQISIRGTFGKRFRIIVNGQKLQFAGFSLSAGNITNGIRNAANSNTLSFDKPQFSSFAKTGFGCVKILERIKEKSKQLDSYQKPFSLYMYNPILGNNYQVEINSFTHSQDIGRNMIPTYSMQLTSVADLDAILGFRGSASSAIRNIGASQLQKGADRISTAVKSALN